MRLDKFLKVSRLIKRRTVASSACGAGRIFVNGREAKAGYQLKIGDEICLEFGKSKLTVKVQQLKETVRKEEAETLYQVVSHETQSAED